MTVKQEDQRTIDGKKVCWNFRKGRCRFGSKCTFAHDSDVKQRPETTNENRGKVRISPMAAASALGASTDEVENPDAVIENNKKSAKKRPGLSEGIVPSKKAMKFHEQVYNRK